LDLVKEINDSIKAELEQKIKNKNIEIDVINDCIDEQCWIYADRLRLNQIINNLMGNAIKFTNQNGKIHIIIENISNLDKRVTGERKNGIASSKNCIEEKREDNKTKDEIFVSISDTGKGISPQIMPKLFEKFITGSNTGTGLGLYIARKLVEAMGGRICAFNNNDGVGSTFVFSLPRGD
jgi:signal transduction histidine kinase